MTQSVELLLDEPVERAVQQEWARLHEARLPTEQRSTDPSRGSQSHRPHITLYAGAEISQITDAELSALVAGLSLPVRLGALTLFGPHRDRYVLVHQVVPSTELLDLQRWVARTCGAEADGHFAPGAWTPHITLARRVAPDQLPDIVDVLAGAGAVGLTSQVTRCRRWDGEARDTWLL